MGHSKWILWFSNFCHAIEVPSQSLLSSEVPGPVLLEPQLDSKTIGMDAEAPSHEPQRERAFHFQCAAQDAGSRGLFPKK